nr:MAG TPA: hypothetical protein [Caudoviricetes sp.]
MLSYLPHCCLWKPAVPHLFEKRQIFSECQQEVCLYP